LDTRFPTTSIGKTPIDGTAKQPSKALCPTPTIPNKLWKKSSHLEVSHTNAHHYFVVLANFFSWVVSEGFLKESPTAKIRMARPGEKTSCFGGFCSGFRVNLASKTVEIPGK
jgi:hypothetical protein